jgi:hypothetical protein
MMPQTSPKTLTDCARRPVLRWCDLHGGNGWMHKAGVVPCVVRV